MSANPPRLPWSGFPDVLIHASESAVKQHPHYSAAKSGDAEAAIELVHDTLNADQVRALGAMFSSETPTLVSAHAYEREGVNAIPEALADALGRQLGWPVDSEVVQSNKAISWPIPARAVSNASHDKPVSMVSSNPAVITSSWTTSSEWEVHWPTSGAIFMHTGATSWPLLH
jgi:hypothetical protein